MAYTIPPTSGIDEGWTPINCQPGATFRTIYAYPNYFTLQDGDEVTTLRFKFALGSPIDLALLRTAVETGIKPIYSQAGDEILAYALCERPIFEVQVPDQVCILDWCFTPPFAGGMLVAAYEYQLWVLSRALAVAPQVARGDVRAVVGPWDFIAIGLVLLILIPLVLGIYEVIIGKMTFRELVGYVRGVITAPGENIKAPIGEAAWPFVALGLALVAFGIFLPRLTTQLGAEVQAGPVKVTGGVGAPAPAPTRRRGS